MPAQRGLSPEERAAWAQLARTVTPMHKQPRKTEAPQRDPAVSFPPAKEQVPGAVAERPGGRVLPRQESRSALAPRPLDSSGGLDSSWERKLRAARAEPDFTLDLHGHTLEAAHARLDRGLAQAKALDARLVLVVTGKPRPAEHADRGERRGAIRAKILDWLAAGPHGRDIAAVRTAHRRHGGDGALYLVLKRTR